VLTGAGYRTALFHSGRFMYLGMDAILKRQGFHTLEDAGAIGGQVESSFGVDESSAVARMLAWIDALPQGQRFFLTYLPVAGHHPYVATTPGPFVDPGEFGAYKNAIYDGDRALGQLLDGLRARQLFDRTLIVVFGDHGEAFGQHDGNFAHTFFVYEENIHVPLVIRASGLGAAVRVSRTASVIDIAPTILDLLGLPTVAAYQGASLLAPRDRMALFYTDYALGWLGLRDGCWKYLFEVESRRSKLFDLCVDPNETNDLSAGHASRVTNYRDRIERWSSAQRAALSSKF
jgi:phosphoglycerol transferase MdoB-like AlkP superfamily enzyme